MAHGRLSGLDVAFLCLEGETTPMHMGAVIVFQPGAPVDGGRLARLLAERAARIPELRRVARPALLPPGSLDWVEDTGFDPATHIHVDHADRRYEPDPLAACASGWIERPLDTARPLWDARLVTGLSGDRFALLLKLHHALTDGAGAYAVAAGLLDDVASPPRSAPRSPPARSLLDTAQAALAQVGAGAAIAASVLQAARPYPVPAVGRRGSAMRRLEFAWLELADLRRIRAAHGGTANDVVLAILAGALREWLRSRGHHADVRDLRALVPVSVRGRAAAQIGGNKLSGYLCDLPVGVDDPVRRLHRVRRSMERNKAAGPTRGAGAFPLLADLLPPAVHRVATKAAGLAAPLLFDTVVTAVPLPAARMHLDGAPVRAVYPLVPLAPRQALGFATATCSDRVHIGLQADAAEVGDLAALRDSVLKSAAALLATA
jgi:diacylglycerol O-acyltransferase